MKYYSLLILFISSLASAQTYSTKSYQCTDLGQELVSDIQAMVYWVTIFDDGRASIKGIVGQGKHHDLRRIRTGSNSVDLYRVLGLDVNLEIKKFSDADQVNLVNSKDPGRFIKCSLE